MGAWFASLLVLPLGAHQTDPVAKIDPAKILVKDFQGWGVSLCWWANVAGGYTNRDQYADLIFKDLKLNIVRYNIGGGENPELSNTLEFRARLPGFEPVRGVWDWSADANQRWMLKAAVARGVGRVEAFANSPPYWMTVSGSVTGAVDGTNNLKTANERDFAVYLAEVVKHLSESDGITFDAVTPVNEPSSDWWVLGGHQEGCHMDARQQDRVIRLLETELNRRHLRLLIDAPEENDEQSGIDSLRTYTTNALDDIGQISTHTYKGNDAEGLASLAVSLHKPLWQTEYGDDDWTGIKMARRIRDDLVQLRPLSWCYWQGADYDGWGLLYNRLRGNGRMKYFISEKFRVFEQFTRFLRPGCELIDCGDANSVAGYDPSAMALAIVTVNDGGRDFKETFDLSKFAGTGETAQCFRTSDHEGFKELPPLKIEKQSFSAVIPADSVTTFVLQGVRKL